MLGRTLVFTWAWAAVALGKVQYLGVTIGGGELGCDINGSCDLSESQLPLADGPQQMKHFVEADGMNMMRIPISWQYLVDSYVDASLNQAKMADYDKLITSCLSTGAHCVIDVHNFGRWDGKVIGQGGPTNQQFARLWRQLGSKYADKSKVVFQLMNAPYGLDVERWAETCQEAVTAIREAGATSQMILLPGNNYDSAATLVSSGSAEALMAIKNPDNSTDNLLLDIHKYLDGNNSGMGRQCTTNNTDSFQSVADFLRRQNRKGLLSETGATSDDSCYTAFCDQNKFINDNSDVFVGMIMWGAGNVHTSSSLSVRPYKTDVGTGDVSIMLQCFLRPWASKAFEIAEVGSSTPSASSTFAVPTASRKPSSSASPTPTMTTTLIHAPTQGKGQVGTGGSTNHINLQTMEMSTMSTLVLATGQPTYDPTNNAFPSAPTLIPMGTAIPTEVMGTPTPTSSPGGSGPDSSASTLANRGWWSPLLGLLVVALML